MYPDLHKCKNCDLEFYGNYCNHCGQKADTERFTFRSLFDNFIYGITNLNRGIFFTIYGLFSRPGIVIKEYIEGKRVSYANPFTLLIILSGVFALLYSTMHLVLDLEPNHILSDKIHFSSNSSFARVIVAFFNWVENNTIFLTIIHLPVNAVVYKYAFRKNGAKRYNYAEMTFIASFLACQTLVIDIVSFPYRWYIQGRLSYTYSFITISIHALLVIWAFKDIFNLSWWKSIKRTILAFLLSLAILLAVVIILSIILVVTNDSP